MVFIYLPIQVMHQAPEHEAESEANAAEPPTCPAPGERLAIHTGYGPTLNGYAGPPLLSFGSLYLVGRRESIQMQPKQACPLHASLLI